MVRTHPDPPRTYAKPCKDKELQEASKTRREGAPHSSAMQVPEQRRIAKLIGDPRGGVAQLGERLLCKQEVIGSIPFTSTKN